MLRSRKGRFLRTHESHWALSSLSGVPLTTACNRYEKEFDKVNDVFELQVRLSHQI
jgi:hypothetical protein